MKKIFYFLILSKLSFSANGQFTSINPSSAFDKPIVIKRDVNGFTHGNKQSTIFVRTTVYNTIGYSNWDNKIMLSVFSFNNLPMLFTTNNGSAQMRLEHNGNFAIGSHIPTSALHVGKYTKLGENAPAIKAKKYAGLTASTQTDSITIPHGLAANKIISINAVFDLAAAGKVFQNYTQSAGYQVVLAHNNTNIFLKNIPTNSGNILNKPYKILLIYEE